MRRNLTSPVRALVIAIVAASLAGRMLGCQGNAPDPTQTLTLANQAFTTTVDTLNALHAAGVFSAGDWANIQKAIAAGSAALDAWGASLNNPGSAIQQYQSAMLSLAQYLKAGTTKVAPAATTQKGGTS